MSIPYNDMASHCCGGTVLSGTIDGMEYIYCEQCAAFTFDDDTLPGGTNRERNKAAWDNQDSESYSLTKIKKKDKKTK